ncbi:MAG: GNAT family N-acetyltransferase [Chloroflexi bacterium]|nr:GNAT family N-acetyltransferase [Chloroflexota bacterium]
MAEIPEARSGQYRFQVVDNPSRTLDEAQKASLISQCCPVVRAAFGNPKITESDIVKHAIEVSTAIFVWHQDDRLIGFSSSVVDHAKGRDIVYLEGIVIDPKFHGLGLYSPLISLRILLGLRTLGTHQALVCTRISSPRIVKTMIRGFGLYPKPGTATPEHLRDAADEFADKVRRDHSDFQGSRFDREHLVVRQAYGPGFCMYGDDLPRCGDDKEIDDFVEQNLNYKDGDAFFMIGECSRDQVLKRLLTSCKGAQLDGEQLVTVFGL